MIPENDSIESRPNTHRIPSEVRATDPLPNSRKVYVNGKLHADLRVPFREISLAPTKSLDGDDRV